MEHGRITQSGTFDGLLAVDGPFRRLASQLKGAETQLQADGLPVTGSRESSSARVASSEPE